MPACDAQTLVNSARCRDCNLSPGMLLPAIIAQSALLAGLSADPQTLLNNAVQLQSLPDGTRIPVLIALACQIAKV